MAKRRTGVAQWIAEAAVPMLVLDRRRRVRVFNRGASRLTGRETGDVIGQIAPFTSEPDAVPIGSVAALLAAIAPSATEFAGSVAAAPVVVPTPQGLRAMRASYLPLEQPDGREPHVLILLLDDPAVPAAPPAASQHTQLAASRVGPGPPQLIATDPAMARPLRQFELAKRSEAAVHLVGEPGTGRRLMAELIHDASPRAEEPLQIVEIARPRRPEQIRAIAAALSTEPDAPPSPGTLVLAEIDRLPLDVQADFADWYADADTPRPRLITTATRTLAELAADGELLRPELASLLGTVSIDLPPLRDRPADLPLLAQSVVERTLSLTGREQPCGLAAETLDLLLAHDWPGNVGELDRCIEAAVRRGTDATIGPDGLPLAFETARHASSLGEPDLLRPIAEVLDEAERRHIEAALQRAGNKAGAAKLLGMTRPKLYRRIAALGIGEPADRRPTAGERGA